MNQSGFNFKKMPWANNKNHVVFLTSPFFLRKEIDQNMGSFGPEGSLERKITRYADEDLNFQYLGGSTYGRSWRVNFLKTRGVLWLVGCIDSWMVAAVISMVFFSDNAKKWCLVTLERKGLLQCKV